MIRKQVITTMIVATVLGATGVVAIAHAQTQGSNPLSGLVKEIATKFNLDESKVQTVVNDYQTKHKAEMDQNREQRETLRLDQLVKDGKITSSQKQAILDEQAKLKSEFSLESMKNLTPIERKAQMQKLHDELRSFAQSQGIDLKYLMPFTGMMGKRGMHRGWMKNTASPTPTPSV